MVVQESIRIEKDDIVVLDEALKTYIAELDYIKHMCRHPVYVGKDSIDDVVKRAVAIKKVIHEVRNVIG